MTDKVQKIRDFLDGMANEDCVSTIVRKAIEKKMLPFIDSLQEEPVSIWHDASEKPERDDLLIETNDGRIIHRQSVNNYGMVKRWAYTSVLLNLDNSCNLGNNSQEEPISEDWENAANNALEGLLDKYDLVETGSCLEMFKLDAEWQKTKDESCSKDLGEYINELSKQFPEVSFVKLSRIAVRVAKWQKEQIMKDATEAIIKVDAGGYPYIPQIELYDYDKDVPLAKEGEKYKVILIKEE